MIVCSCNVITRQEVEEAVINLLNENAWGVITPSIVYSSLSKQGKCCGCFPNIAAIIAATTQAHRCNQTYCPRPDDTAVCGPSGQAAVSSLSNPV